MWMKMRRPRGGRAEKGQKTGKQEPYRGDGHPGTPHGMYRADINPTQAALWPAFHCGTDGGGPLF